MDRIYECTGSNCGSELRTGSRWKSSYVLGGTVAVSKTFQILYRKEDVELYDVFTFKVYMMVDINKVS